MIKASTQKFIEIKDIRDNIVLLSGGEACTIVQITSTNFALLAKGEQDAKIYAYASLLNSLSFPVQILVRSKRVQIVGYLKSLEDQAKKASNPQIAEFIRKYHAFIQQMITTTTVLDKQFYLVISYSALEAGITGLRRALSNAQQDNEAVMGAKAMLKGKVDSIIGLVDRLGLRARVLGEDELTKLFYDIFNPEGGVFQGDLNDMTEIAAIKKKKK